MVAVFKLVALATVIFGFIAVRGSARQQQQIAQWPLPGWKIASDGIGSKDNDLLRRRQLDVAASNTTAMSVSTIPGCTSVPEVLIAQSGVFGTGYAPEYPNNLQCRWRIQGPPGKLVRVTFSQFVTECAYDYLSVYDAEPPSLSLLPLSPVLMARMCGNRTTLIAARPGGEVLVSTGPTMDLVFTSDVDIAGSGFVASYQIVDACWSACGGRGICVNGKCQCNPGATGPLCDDGSCLSNIHSFTGGT
ncbi:CUB domain-containing protein [Blastocladiella britannica]|nr:CUB domain-containing protein [Blastocladiella britannica]